MLSAEKSFVIIPVRNEDDRVAPVIEAAQSASRDIINTEHVIVVDNHSSPEDRAGDIARCMGAKVLECAEVGKGWAMKTGVDYAQELGASTVTFLDGDLVNLQGDHVSFLADSVVNGEMKMNIGYLGGRTPLAKRVLNKWGAFSGQRAVSLDVWGALRERDLKGWRTEGALNAVCRNSGLGQRIQRIELEDVKHIGKREKERNLPQASKRYFETYGGAIIGLTSRSRI